MFLEEINQIIFRELQGLRRELEAYSNEADIWKTPVGIANSAGTLALHLIGNLRHYIGAQLGNSGYVRNREAEFSLRNVPRTEILTQIDAAIAEVNTALSGLPPKKLETEYPLEIAGVYMQTRDWLLHLISHLAYHLGQVDYHRRLVTGQTDTVRTISVRELKTARKSSN